MSDESAWLSALRRGDREAQRLCYEQHAARLLAVIHDVLHHDPHAAADVLQDTFLKAFAGVASFRGESQFSTWLHRLAVNEALQYLRRRKRMPVSLPDGVDATAPLVQDTFDEVESVQAALAQLSPEHRLILLLKYRDGLDYAQIAEQVDIAPGTVASRLNRARAELKEIMQRVMNGRPLMEESPQIKHPKKEPDSRISSVSADPGIEGLP